MADRLQVSPATISKAIRLLEGQTLVRRERDARGRRERYVIDGAVWLNGWLASARMTAALAATALRGARMLGTATAAGARMRDTGRFLDHVSKDMLEAAEHWRHLVHSIA